MTLPSEQPHRPAAADINAAIRGLWVDGVLPAECRREYARLVVAWVEATQAEQELAA